MTFRWRRSHTAPGLSRSMSLSGPGAEVDRHDLVEVADELRGVPHRLPAQSLEERHVGDLDVGQHPVPSPLPRGLHREPHERRTEAPPSEGVEDGQPVPLPQPLLVERVQADGPAGHRPPQREHLQGGRVVVVLVPVGPLEEPLLLDEDASADLVVEGLLVGRGRQPARYREAPRERRLS